MMCWDWQVGWWMRLYGIDGSPSLGHYLVEEYYLQIQRRPVLLPLFVP
jgi:hypothetical protein